MRHGRCDSTRPCWKSCGASSFPAHGNVRGAQSGCCGAEVHPRSRSRKPGGPCASVVRDAVGFAGCIGTLQQAAWPRPARRRWGEFGGEQQTGKLGLAWGRGPAGHLFLPRVRLARIGRSAARHRKWPAWVARDTRQQLRFCALSGAAPRAQRSERGRHPPAVRPLWFRPARGRRARGSRPGAGVLTCRPAPDSALLCDLGLLWLRGSSHLHTERVEPGHCQGPILIQLPGLVCQPGNWRSRLPNFLFSLFFFFLWYSIP